MGNIESVAYILYIQPGRSGSREKGEYMELDPRKSMGVQVKKGKYGHLHDSLFFRIMTIDEIPTSKIWKGEEEMHKVGFPTKHIVR